MKLAFRVILLAALFVRLPVRSSAQSELLEEVKRLQGEVADLRDAGAAQNRRITQMQKEIESLREAVRESRERATAKMGDFATREDLKRIMESIRDVDQKRESDRKLILGEFEKLGKTLSQPQPAERTEHASSRKQSHREKEKPKESEKEAAPVEERVLPYKVKDGQRLADIIKEYNGELKKQGLPPVSLEQVKRANPKMNINRILTGQEILLPVPDKKK